MKIIVLVNIFTRSLDEPQNLQIYSPSHTGQHSPGLKTGTQESSRGAQSTIAQICSFFPASECFAWFNTLL